MSALEQGWVRGRRSNRLRILLNDRLTPATVLDWACESHPHSQVVSAEGSLPYPHFREGQISAGGALSFVSCVAAILRAVGMARGDRVAIYKRNQADYFLLAHSVIRAGGVAVPINPGMRLEKLGAYLTHTGAKILCSDSEHFADAIRDVEHLPMVERWVMTDAEPEGCKAAAVLSSALEEMRDGLAPVALSDDAPVMLAHTSGTTGTPKAIVCTSGSLMEGIRVHYRTEPPLPWKRVGVAGPFSHLVHQIGLTTLLLSNMPTRAIGNDDPRVSLEAIERDRLNFFVAFPELYMRMYAAGLDGYDLSSMRVWVGVADSSQEAHMKAFCRQGGLLRIGGRTLLGSIFVEPLGSSEIGGPALRRFWHQGARVRCRRRIGRRMLGGPKVKAANAEGRRMRPGGRGVLMVKGPTVFVGYWNDPERTRRSLRDGWWATGDVAYRDRLGRFYHLDRETDVVRTRHGPFYTLPAEDVIHAHPGVLEAVVFGVEDGEHELPTACIWAADDADLDLDDLLRWANARISGPAALQAIEAVEAGSIPRGLTGKVLKRVLRERHRAARGTTTQSKSNGDGGGDPA